MLRMTQVFSLKFESQLCHTFASQKFRGRAKTVKDGSMKTLPQNIVPFVLRGLPPLNKLGSRHDEKTQKTSGSNWLDR